MTTPPPDYSPPAQPSAVWRPVSLRFALGLMVVLSIAQALVYHESFAIKPAGDDFPYVNEINRGNHDGPLVFFTRSFTAQTYRPLASLGIWTFGNVALEHRPFMLRLLAFICMAILSLTTALWMAALGLPRVGAVVAAMVLLFHPVLPAALGSIDGFNAIFSTAMLWLGAWFVWRFSSRPWLAALAVFACFLIGVGAKEYVMALALLAPWTALCLTDRRRMKLAMIVAGAAALAFVVILTVRAATIPPGNKGGLNYASINPLQWARNAGIIIVGLLFFGNSVWVFLRNDAIALAATGAAVLVAATIIIVGLRRAHASRRWVVFLLASVVLSSFPASIMTHVSEMYLPPMIVPLALLCGLAAAGWARSGRAPRMFATVTFVLAMISSIWTIMIKVHDLRLLGERAEKQLRQVLDFVPLDAQDVRIMLLFDESVLPPRRTYSVYLMGDENLLVHEVCPEWLRPERNITLQSRVIGRDSYDLTLYDLALTWDAQTQSFHRQQQR